MAKLSADQKDEQKCRTQRPQSASVGHKSVL